MKLINLILPLALAVSTAYSEPYKLYLWGKTKNGSYAYKPSGCYCTQSRCENAGKKNGLYKCKINYECGTC